MIQYGVLFATGFLFLYQLLVPWGWSADLVSPGPYYALLGGLVIFPFSAVATLWRPRIAAWSGLAGGVLGMVWPITALVLGLGRWSELLFCAALPTVIIAFSLYRVLRLRAIAGARVRLPAAVAALLVLLPFLVFFSMFHSGAIARVIVQGPPPWPGRG